MITKLRKNQIFVCGTNLAGQHYGGAAAQAHNNFGLKWGVAEGLSGRTYALPTLDNKLKKLSDKQLDFIIWRFWRVAKENLKKEFLLTKVGCGIAGYNEEYIKSKFVGCPKNIIKPINW